MTCLLLNTGLHPARSGQAAREGSAPHHSEGTRPAKTPEGHLGWGTATPVYQSQSAEAGTRKGGEKTPSSRARTEESWGWAAGLPTALAHWLARS